MIVSPSFVYSDLVKKSKLPRYVASLNRMQQIRGLYVVVVSKDSPNLLEAMSVSEFYRHLNRHRQLIVVGLAKDRDDAFLCIGYISKQAIDVYGEITKEILERMYLK